MRANQRVKFHRVAGTREVAMRACNDFLVCYTRENTQVVTALQLGKLLQISSQTNDKFRCVRIACS